MKKQKQRNNNYLWFYGIAAVMVLAVGIGICWRQFSNPISEPEQGDSPSSDGVSDGTEEDSSGQQPSDAPEGPPEDLPALTPWQICDADGLRYEAYRVDNIEDLKEANPWTEGAELTTLPVYRNDCVSSIQLTEEVRQQNNLPLLEGKREAAEEKEALARSVAESLGLTVESVEVYPDEKAIAAAKEKAEGAGGTFSKGDIQPTRVTLTCSGGVTVTAYEAWEAWVNFSSPVPLPEEYHFDYRSTYEEMTAAGEYLMEQYKGLLKMENPVLNINGGSLGPEGAPRFSCDVYEGAGALTQQMLNVQFNTVRFSPDGEGNLNEIYITRFDLWDKLGDYPIYTAEEALQKLEEGFYIAPSAEEFSDSIKIEKTDLVYRSVEDVTIMPYYRFFAGYAVQIEGAFPDDPNNSRIEKMYAVYYVPAVREEYIEAMPQWNGIFNG
ncbi:MAG: hypothetical protein HFE44_00740 [Oscillospiraceae bacterium]|jgi:hypothetical protein|nr:hypothetical protein [Oscillospiraceae bacterium]